MIAPPILYKTEPECLIALFDLRCPGAEQRLRRELAAWRGFAHTEMLTDHRVALIMQPGGAAR
jgi:hypothetical protein